MSPYKSAAYVRGRLIEAMKKSPDYKEVYIPKRRNKDGSINTDVSDFLKELGEHKKSMRKNLVSRIIND